MTSGAEILYAASKFDTMPRFLSKENESGVPSNALWLTNIVVQVFLILTLFAQYAFTLALELTSSMILIRTFWLRLTASSLDRRDIRAGSSGHRGDFVRAGIALLYTAGLIYAAGAKRLLLSAAICGPGTILYFMARREQSTRAFTPAETAIFMVAAIDAVAAISRLDVLAFSRPRNAKNGCSFTASGRNKLQASHIRGISA